MSEVPTQLEEDLREFQSFKRYLAGCENSAFSSLSRAKWFVRKHRRELIESGQYVPRRGSGGGLIGPRFGAVVLKIMRRDPKGEQDLKNAAERACRSAGEPGRFVHFHPAFPRDSARIDPLHSFNRATEVASRVAALIPSETGNDPFKAFGQMAMSNVVQGLLAVGERPSLVTLRRYLEGGAESLVERSWYGTSGSTCRTGRPRRSPSCARPAIRPPASRAWCATIARR